MVKSRTSKFSSEINRKSYDFYSSIQSDFRVKLVKKIKPSNFITISPNPLTEKSVVKIDPVMINRYGKLTFLLYDQFGKKLKTIKNITKSEFEISCEDFLPGIYFISISGDNRIIESVKIIIK